MSDDLVREGDGANPGQSTPGPRLSRRMFIAKGGAVAASASAAAMLTACDTELGVPPVNETGPMLNGPASTTNATNRTLPTSIQYFEVPYTPTAPPPVQILRFFTPAEARTVEALTARIFPGSPDDPGAREAGVVRYIDNFLATDGGFPEPTYRTAPYAQTYDPEQGPPEVDGPYTIIWVAGDQVQRYGYQSILSPQDVYRSGIASVDRYANQTFDKAFTDLTEDQQDQVIGDMVNGQASGFDPSLSGEAFFHNLRRHTAEGLFSDPVYGGNQDLVGWKLIGYPGAQRAYTPEDIRTEGYMRAPQSIMAMMPFQPGVGMNPNAIEQVVGSDIPQPGDPGATTGNVEGEP